MTEHRPWCPLLGGGRCACAETRDDRTLDLFAGVEQPGLAEALALVEEAVKRASKEDP
jgi:hypothetical protein